MPGPATQRRPRRSRGLMISGFVVFGVSYLVPAFIGAAVAGIDEEVCDCSDALRMFIPLAGPLTLIHSDDDYYYLNALLIFDAVVQGAGLALSIWGIIRYVESGREQEFAKQPDSPLTFSLVPTPHGAYGSLRLQL
jgi:hypothetical protein